VALTLRWTRGYTGEVQIIHAAVDGKYPQMTILRAWMPDVEYVQDPVRDSEKVKCPIGCIRGSVML